MRQLLKDFRVPLDILEQMESDPGLRRIRLDSVADADGHRIGETGPDRAQRDLLRRQGSGGQFFH